LASIEGVSRSALRPFYNQSFRNSQRLRVEAGKFDRYYIEVYDHFSMLFFCANCPDYDIVLRVFYIGAFDKGEGPEARQLLYDSGKKQGTIEESVEAISPGIYVL
jgi:hypothetical protein